MILYFLTLLIYHVCSSQVPLKSIVCSSGKLANYGEDLKSEELCTVFLCPSNSILILCKQCQNTNEEEKIHQIELLNSTKSRVDAVKSLDFSILYMTKVGDPCQEYSLVISHDCIKSDTCNSTFVMIYGENKEEVTSINTENWDSSYIVSQTEIVEQNSYSLDLLPNSNSKPNKFLDQSTLESVVTPLGGNSVTPFYGGVRSLPLITTSTRG